MARSNCLSYADLATGAGKGDLSFSRSYIARYIVVIIRTRNTIRGK